MLNRQARQHLTSPMVLLASQGHCACSGVLDTSSTLRTSEKPLECTPLEGKATTLSPALTLLPSISLSFLTAPTAKPARSYSPDW